MDVYNRCADQWQADQSGRQRIDNQALESALRLLRIHPDDRLELFDRVKMLTRAIQGHIARMQKQERDKHHAATKSRSRR